MLKNALHRFGYDLRRIAPQPDRALPLRTLLTHLRDSGRLQTIVDLGANTGQSATHFATAYPGATVYSVEPHRASFDALVANTAALPNVRCHHLGIGEADGSPTLIENKNSVTNSFLPAASGIDVLIDADWCDPIGTAEVEVIRLPTFCARVGVERIDFLKIDTQGFEDRILRGAQGWLTPDRLRLAVIKAIFVDHYDDQAEVGEIISLMAQCGFRVYALHGTQERAADGYLWTNLVFVPRDRAEGPLAAL